MKPLGQLKQEMEDSNNLADLIDALKLAASLRLNQFQKVKNIDSNFLESIDVLVSALEKDHIDHPLFFLEEGLPEAFVVVTSDGGFMGELNRLLVNAAQNRMDSERDELIVIGTRGAQYAKECGLRFLEMDTITEPFDMKRIESLGNHLLDNYLTKKFGKTYIVYAKSESVSSQKVTVRSLLPLSTEDFKKNSDRDGLIENSKYFIEPDLKSVIESIVRLRFSVYLYDVFWDACFSEYAARLMHLEGSDQELQVLQKTMKRDYFRSAHEKADKSIREISVSLHMTK